MSEFTGRAMLGPAIAAYVTGAEATRRRFSEAYLRHLAASLSVEDVISSLSKLAWLVHSDPALADGALVEMCRRGDRRRIWRYAGRRALLFPGRVGAAMREALLHSDRRAAQNLEAAGQRALAMLLLGVVDVYGDDREVEEPLAELRRYGLRQLVARSTPPPVPRMARMRRLFVEIPGEEGDPFGVLSAFEAEVGMPLDRYLAICFGIVSRWQWLSERPDRWPLTYEYFRLTSISRDYYERVISGVAATPDEFAAMYRTEMACGRSALDDLAPFASRPLCRLSGDRLVPVDPPKLLERLLGDGVYWRLKAIFDRRRQGATFGAAVGKALERHLREIAHSTLDHDTSIRIFDEVFYRTPNGRCAGPDLAFWQNGELVMVEIGATRCHYGHTILTGDLASYAADIERIFVGVDGRARQLDRNLRSLRAGELRYLGVPADAPVRPIICLIDGFPRGPLLNDDVARAINDHGLLQQSRALPCAILSAADFEVLCALAATGARVGALLDAWQHAAPHGALGDWAVSQGYRSVRPALVDDHIRRAFESWVSQLGLTARAA